MNNNIYQIMNNNNNIKYTKIIIKVINKTQIYNFNKVKIKYFLI